MERNSSRAKDAKAEKSTKKNEDLTSSKDQTMTRVHCKSVEAGETKVVALATCKCAKARKAKAGALKS